MIGKKAMTAASTILEVMPNPNQTMKSGISATFGMTWSPTISGLSDDSSHGILPRSPPRTMPTTTAMTKPTTISTSVTMVWFQVRGSDSSVATESPTAKGEGRMKGETSKRTT